MTFDRAASHSMPQLKALRAAARRLNAERDLANAQVCFAAFAAVMAKEGKKIFEKHCKSLIKQIESHE